jgi:hypothetical protein
MLRLILAVLALVMRFPAAVGALFVALGLYGAGSFLVDRTQWVATEARVMSVSEMCHMEATLSRTRRSREVLRGTVPCDRVAAQKARHPGLDFSISRRLSATVAYASPTGARLEASKPIAMLGLTDGVMAGTLTTIEYRAAQPSEIRPGGDLSGLVWPLFALLIGGCFLFLWHARRTRATAADPANAGQASWADRVDLPPIDAPAPAAAAGVDPRRRAPAPAAAPSPSPAARVVRTPGASPTLAPSPATTRIVRSGSAPARPATTSSRPARTGLVAPPAPLPRGLGSAAIPSGPRPAFGRRG